MPGHHSGGASHGSGGGSHGSDGKGGSHSSGGGSHSSGGHGGGHSSSGKGGGQTSSGSSGGKGHSASGKSGGQSGSKGHSSGQGHPCSTLQRENAALHQQIQRESNVAHRNEASLRGQNAMLVNDNANLQQTIGNQRAELARLNDAK